MESGKWETPNNSNSLILWIYFMFIQSMPFGTQCGGILSNGLKLTYILVGNSIISNTIAPDREMSRIYIKGKYKRIGSRYGIPHLNPGNKLENMAFAFV